MQCLIDNKFQECALENQTASNTSIASNQMSKPEQQSTQTVMTVNGDKCEFPFQYRGEMHDNCIEVGGKRWCKVSDELQECAQGNQTEQSQQESTQTVMTVNGDKCEFPFQYRGEIHDNCVEIAGVMSCEANGEIQECDLGNQSVQSPQETAKTVTTVNGDLCEFPFYYRGEQYNECVEISGKMRCLVDNKFQECDLRTRSNQMQMESANTVMTVSGDQCEFPFYYRGEQYNECVEISGKMRCLVDNKFQECDLRTRSNQMQMESANTVMTVSGDQCEFPFSYRGEVHENCVQISGKMQCLVKGEFQEMYV
eukprot:TRINITY_DN38317_c0_g1_i1.p1 TRINITY_DN38317_c0_g1~~TRINITY_DN38317_c0_g1_i1.p1  ORF type:complete len:356 (+),score=20.19 TRINITY_DN38317_c0_g1_i1:136-1068(+)